MAKRQLDGNPGHLSFFLAAPKTEEINLNASACTDGASVLAHCTGSSALDSSQYINIVSIYLSYITNS